MLRASKQNKVRKPKSLVTRAEESFNSGPAYHAYRLLFALGDSRAATVLSPLPKLGLPSFRFRKYRDLGYRHHFKIGKLREAYGHRITYAATIEQDGQDFDGGAGRYLDLTWSEEWADLFPVEPDIRGYLKRRQRGPELFPRFQPGAHARGVGRVLMIGPAGDPSTTPAHDFNRICFTKPVDLAAYGLRADQVILVLNNVWSMHKRDVVVDWIHKNEGAIVFSPNDLQIDYDVIGDYSVIPEFRFGSPMGLQRALTLILTHLAPEAIEVEGFDFSLSPTPYRNWYPNLRDDFGFRNVRETVLYSSLGHDFLLNFLYIKRLKQMLGPNLSGGIDRYLQIGVGEVLELFRRRICE